MRSCHVSIITLNIGPKASHKKRLKLVSKKGINVESDQYKIHEQLHELRLLNRRQQVRVVVQVTTAFFALSSSSRSIEGIRYAIGIPAHWHVIIASMPFFAKLPFPLIYLSAADEISIWVNADHVKRNSIRAHLRCNYYNIFLAPAHFAALSLNRKLQALQREWNLLAPICGAFMCDAEAAKVMENWRFHGGCCLNAEMHSFAWCNMCMHNASGVQNRSR